MRRIDIAIRASKSLKQAKARTILTALAIAVGACTICLALAASNGANAYINDMVKDRGDDRVLTISQTYHSDEAPAGPEKIGAEEEKKKEEKAKDAAYPLDKTDIEKIAAVDGVASVDPEIYIYAYSVDGKDGAYVTSAGVQSDERNIEFLGGIEKSFRIEMGSVGIPESYLTALGFESVDEAIGKEVTLNFYSDPKYMGGKDPKTFSKKFIVSAVIADSDRFFGGIFLLSRADSEVIYKKQVSEDGKYYVLVAKVASGADIKKVQESIKAVGDYDVYSMMDVQESLFEAVNMAKWGLIGFGALALLASVFGIVNTQYISVLERTQQIGLMKALGMRRKDVSKLFRYEAAWIGLLGGLIGVFVAFLVTLLNPMITGILGLEKGTRMLIIDPIPTLVLIAALVVVAVASGYFPARKASKLDPIEALRTE